MDNLSAHPYQHGLLRGLSVETVLAVMVAALLLLALGVALALAVSAGQPDEQLMAPFRWVLWDPGIA